MWAERFDPHLTPGKINKEAESFTSAVANGGRGIVAAPLTRFISYCDGRRPGSRLYRQSDS